MAKKFSFKARKGTLGRRVTALHNEVDFFTSKFDKAMRAMFVQLGDEGEDVLDFWDAGMIELFTEIKGLTPFKTGNAKNSWQIERKAVKDFISYGIFNGVPYIVFLEFGSSKKAPKGMVRISLDRFTKVLNKRLEKIGK